MIKSFRSNWLRSITCIGLVATILASTSLTALALPGKTLGGEIIISDGSGGEAAVLLNGEPVLSGRTFLTAGTISTPETRSATVNLGKLGRVSLSPASTLSLSLSENSISGTLSNGAISVSSNEGVSININTPDTAIENDSATAGSFNIAIQAGKTVVTATSGRATMDGWKTTVGQKDPNKSDNYGGLYIYIAIAATVIIAILVADDDDENLVVSPVR